MDLKKELLGTLSRKLENDSVIILNNISGFKTPDDDSKNKPIRKKRIHVKNSIYFKAEGSNALPQKSVPFIKKFSIILILGIAIVWSLITVFTVKNGPQIYSPRLPSLKLLPSQNVILVIVVLFLLLVGLLLIVRIIKNRLTHKLKLLAEIEPKQEKDEFSDEVYLIITNTYETLSIFRKERERQAKLSYNASLGLIIIGIGIVFFGVLMLFKKNIVEGSLTAGVGAISNIIGGTILLFYRDTNNRMDLLNNDLFTLNTAKVQYALILKIKDEGQRDLELAKLISTIGEIKKTEHKQ